MATAAKRIDNDTEELDRDYRPSPSEEFMNPRQQAYFRRKLQDWKESILRESRETLNQLQVDSLREPDVTDRASSETDWGIELRTRDRQRKLIPRSTPRSVASTRGSMAIAR